MVLQATSMLQRGQVLICLLLLVVQLRNVLADYRHLALDNNDLCDSGTTLLGTSSYKKLSIGTGALIIELSRPRLEFHSSKYKAKRCEIQIKAPEGFGILAYIEEAFLRRNSSDRSCKDYIQFGQDDRIPFVTVTKSDKVCGYINGKSNVNQGYTYNDPHGNLLVWVNLWGRKETRFWPHINTVNLTLILTAYQAECGFKQTMTKMAPRSKVRPPGPGFALCGVNSNECISKRYFCDGKFNCALDGRGNARSHDELGCDSDGNVKTTPKPDNVNSSVDSGGYYPGGLNLISWAMIIVSAILGIILALILIVSFQRSRGSGCCLAAFGPEVAGDLHGSQSCEFPEQHVHNLHELAALRQHHPGAEPNNYLPLDSFVMSARGAGAGGQQQNVGGPPIPDEPPPAYDQLFPEGPPEVTQETTFASNLAASTTAAEDPANVSSDDGLDEAASLERPRTLSESD